MVDPKQPALRPLVFELQTQVARCSSLVSSLDQDLRRDVSKAIAAGNEASALAATLRDTVIRDEKKRGSWQLLLLFLLVLRCALSMCYTFTSRSLFILPDSPLSLRDTVIDNFSLAFTLCLSRLLRLYFALLPIILFSSITFSLSFLPWLPNLLLVLSRFPFESKSRFLCLCLSFTYPLSISRSLFGFWCFSLLYQIRSLKQPMTLRPHANACSRAEATRSSSWKRWWRTGSAPSNDGYYVRALL